ncbi:SRPBCC family protein [Nocardia aurantiaca]|uniref:SRPBCC domain-containing protein n=1 Tax=Nocardia aurantiaca TaxID=2675850 RepID=A0A6I3KUY4_9NOCA|nr:SRPBCC domain-containing protein [Nocardia aurantiaca]MTE13357.1 SRPBCC domain-containing protein [Nocardia aurantiaca]
MIADPRLNPAAVELGSFFRPPPDAVWRALTEPDLLERWLLRPTGFAASVGTHFRFIIPDSSINEIICEVLAARRCKQLTYSWMYPRAEYPARWIVDWTLQPQGRGTRLLLTQTGFDIEDRRQKMVRNAMERSWKRLVLPRLGEAIHH